MSYKFDAMVSILNWMESGRTVTPQSIQEHLEISARTAFRYMQTLEGAGFPVYFDKKLGTYRFVEGYTLRTANLSIPEKPALEGGGIDLEATQRLLINSLQPIQFAGNLPKLLKDFTGREWVKKEVDAWLADADGSKIFWLQGPPGVGKSAISAWLLDKCRQIFAYHFCDINSEETRDASKLVTSIAYQLSTQLPDYQRRLAGLNISDIVAQYSEAYTLFDKLIAQPIAEDFPEPDRTVVILIDALDEATDNHKNDIALFLSRCALKTPIWLRFLVTSRPEPEVNTLFQSFSPLVLDTSSAANYADIAKYLRAKLPGITEEQVKNILDRSEGMFLYAKHVCDENRSGRLSLDLTDEFPRGLGDVYARFFLRQFKGDIEGYRKEIRPLLSIIQASLRPLQLGFIMQVLGYGNRMELFDQLDTLGSLFPRSGDNEDDTITTFHRSLNDWLSAKDRSGQFYIDSSNGHKILADHGWQQYQQAPETMADYHLEYLQSHLAVVSQYERVVVMLKDFRFMMARTKAGFIGRLLSDYREIISGLPKEQRQQIRIEESFFRSNGHILRRGNNEWPSYKILLQLAVEHADGSPLSIGAEKFLADGGCDWTWLRRELRVEHAGVDPCVAVFEGHTGGVRYAIEMPDGRIWSCAHDSSIRIWDKETSYCLKTLEGHSGGVYGLRLTENEQVISWAGDGTIRLWSSDGELIVTMIGHEDEVNGALELSNGTILSWSCDRTLKIWDKDGYIVKGLEGHTETVSGALQHPDGQILSWGNDNTLRLWSVNGDPLKVMTGHTSSVLKAQFIPDGRLISISMDSTIIIWSIEGELLQTLDGCWSGIELLHDGKLLSWSNKTDSALGSIAVWNTMPEFRINNVWEAEIFGELMVLSDDRILSCTYLNENMVRICDKEGALLKTLPGGASWTDGALLLSDGLVLTWGEDENSFYLFDTSVEKQESLIGHTHAVDGCLLLSGGRFLTWSIFEDTVRIWNNSGEPFALLKGHTKWIWNVLLLSDGRILTCSGDGTLRIWNDHGETLAILEGHSGAVCEALLFPDGRILSWCGNYNLQDTTLRVWSKRGEPLAVLNGHTKRICSAHILSDGRILSYSNDNTLRLWRSNGEPLAVLAGHTGGVNGALLFPDGRILSWSDDHTLRIWSDDGQPLAVLEGGHKFPVSGANLLPDGQIHSWSWNRSLCIWDNNRKPTVLEGAVRGSQPLPDGRILSWDSGNTLCLHDGHSGKCLADFSMKNVFAAEPVVWRAYLSDERQAVGAALDSFRTYSILGGVGIKPIYWHGTSECTSQHLFEDGSAIVTQENGQVCLLRPYNGDKPVTITELLPRTGLL